MPVVLQCSADCGKGIQKRTVTCTNSQGKCDAATRPRDEEECEDHTGCYEWKTGDWSKVTVNSTWYFLPKCKDVQSAMPPSAVCVNLQFKYLKRKGLTGFDWSFCCVLHFPLLRFMTQTLQRVLMDMVQQF